MLNNPNLIQYQLSPLLTEGERFWYDFETLKEIDLTTVTDSELEKFVLQYPNWADDIVIPPATEGFLYFGGAFFIENELPPLINENGDVYVPSSYERISMLTPNGGHPIVKVGYWLSNDPPSAEGTLNSINISGVSDISYMAGSLPAYCTEINTPNIGLEVVLLNNIPPTVLTVDMADNRMDRNSVDSIVSLCAGNEINGISIDLTGENMASPSNKGLTAINTLLQQGWDVLYESE